MVTRKYREVDAEIYSPRISPRLTFPRQTPRAQDLSARNPVSTWFVQSLERYHLSRKFYQLMPGVTSAELRLSPYFPLHEVFLPRKTGRSVSSNSIQDLLPCVNPKWTLCHFDRGFVFDTLSQGQRQRP